MFCCAWTVLEQQHASRELWPDSDFVGSLHVHAAVYIILTNMCCNLFDYSD